MIEQIRIFCSLDPLEFIDLLMAKALNVKPYLEISTGQKSFCYQLFVASDPSRRSSPTVQEIFLQSFKESNITLMTVPKILILQMPRNGVINKVFDQILPTKFLDVTDVVEEGKFCPYVVLDEDIYIYIFIMHTNNK